MASALEYPVPAEIPVDLVISKGHLGLTRGNLKVFDAQGNLVYRVDGRSSDSKKWRILLDSVKNPLFSIYRCDNDGGWQGYRGDSLERKDLIFRVQSTLCSRLRTELEVFLVEENCEWLVPDFRLKGSPFHRACIIYRGNSIAAQTSAMYKLGKPIVGRSKFRLTLYPGIEHSFVIALLVIFFDGGDQK